MKNETKPVLPLKRVDHHNQIETFESNNCTKDDQLSSFVNVSKLNDNCNGNLNSNSISNYNYSKTYSNSKLQSKTNVFDFEIDFRRQMSPEM